MKSAIVFPLAVTLSLLSGSDASNRLFLRSDRASGEQHIKLGREWHEQDEARRTEAQRKHASQDALRADLASPWTSLVVAHHYQCSCTGLRQSGFEITRSQEAITLSQWGERLWYPSPMVSRSLAEGDLETILSVVPLHYLTAILTEDPYEVAGPHSEGGREIPGWRARYIRAGGPPFGPMDRYGIEIRITTPDGLKTYVDYFDPNAPTDFGRWMYRIWVGKVEDGGKR